MFVSNGGVTCDDVLCIDMYNKFVVRIYIYIYIYRVIFIYICTHVYACVVI